MAWSENKVVGNFNTSTQKFICDAEADLGSLSKSTPLGRSAFCIKEALVYMISSQSEQHRL